MANLLKVAFSTGVMAPEFKHRSDLERHSLGLARAENCFVNVSGSISARPGMEFLEPIDDQSLTVRMLKFQFNKRLGNTYLIILTNGKIYFLQNGRYITETGRNSSGLSGETITLVAHGFVVGDWVSISNRTCVITSIPTADTFTCRSVVGDTTITPLSGTAIFKIYTIPNPYLAADFATIYASQDKDAVYLTSPLYPPKKLLRFDHNDWVLFDISFEPVMYSPGVGAIVSTPSGTSGVAYCITSVNNQGLESSIEQIGYSEGIADITATAGSIKVTWLPVPEAIAYRVYRSLISPIGADISLGADLGYVGQTFAAQFIDNNIVPDFSIAPAAKGSPFDHGAVVAMSVTAGGTGYAKAAPLVITDPTGTGFEGIAVADNTGKIIGTLIYDPGKNYTAPVVSVSGVGSGASIAAVVGALSGNYPSVSARLQQRRIYAGTSNFPMAVVASATGSQEDFRQFRQPQPTNAFTLFVDADQMAPINDLIPFTDGLLAFTESGIYNIYGANGAPVSPDTLVARSIGGVTAAGSTPLSMPNEIVFLNTNALGVTSVQVGENNGQLTTRPLSELAYHYFTLDNRVQSWAYRSGATNRIYAQLADGDLLFCAYHPEQNLVAWTHGMTSGDVIQIESLTENKVDEVYALVDRGTGRIYLERFLPEGNITIENSHQLDSCSISPVNRFEATVYCSGPTGFVTVVCDNPIFSSGIIGEAFRMWDGRGTVTAFIDANTLEVEIEIPITKFANNSPAIKPATKRDWSLTEKKTRFRFLEHLEGLGVAVIADGAYAGIFTVNEGEINLPYPASQVIVGLQAYSSFSTFPLSSQGEILQGTLKRINDVKMLLQDCRGVTVNGYEVKNRFYEPLTMPANLLSGTYDLTLASKQDYDGVVDVTFPPFFRGTVLGIVYNVEIQ